jgi:hypothetical protein
MNDGIRAAAAVTGLGYRAAYQRKKGNL